MALPVNIHALLHARLIESERLEFKKSWNPVSVMHSLCAFANDINHWGGGYIIIGIEEMNKQPVFPPTGLSAGQIDKIQREITEICHKIQPNYMPLLQPASYQNRQILIIWAPAGDVRPYSARESLGSKEQKGRYFYIRSGSSTIKARGENLIRLQELTARIPFDDRINQQAQLSDLNLGLIRDYLQEIGSELSDEVPYMSHSEVCRQMNLAKGPEEALRPVNAGLLFFCRDPQRFFNRAWIEVVLRKDEAGKDFVEKYFKGPLHTQLFESLNFIRSNFIEEKTRKIPGQAEARRFFNWPFEAVEEALVNAVYHKSYESGAPVEVQIWPDKIEILNFPGPLPSVAVQLRAAKTRIVARDIRNRRLGEFLKELHLTEARGTGMPTIYRKMKTNGSPPPVFETDEEGTYFLCTLFIHPEFYEKQSNESLVSDHFLRLFSHHKRAGNTSGTKASEHIQQERSYRRPLQKMAGTENTQAKQHLPEAFHILCFCLFPRTSAEIMHHLDRKNNYHNVKKCLTPLLKNNWLSYAHPDNPTHRKQQYYTTSEGEKHIASLIEPDVRPG